jgi:hypothetical protein
VAATTATRFVVSTSFSEVYFSAASGI